MIRRLDIYQFYTRSAIHYFLLIILRVLSSKNKLLVHKKIYLIHLNKCSLIYFCIYLSYEELVKHD